MTSTIAARKVADLLMRVARVRELLPPTAAEMIARRTECEALLLNLYLALQGVSDLAMHTVADRGLGVPADARGALAAIMNAGLIDASLAARLGAAIGLRNRIAHQYGTLDLALVHAAARDDLGDLEALAAAIAKAYGI